MFDWFYTHFKLWLSHITAVSPLDLITSTSLSCPKAANKVKFITITRLITIKPLHITVSKEVRNKTNIFLKAVTYKITNDTTLYCTHCSLMGMTMKSFLKRSTWRVHVFTRAWRFSGSLTEKMILLCRCFGHLIYLFKTNVLRLAVSAHW